MWKKTISGLRNINADFLINYYNADIYGNLTISGTLQSPLTNLLSVSSLANSNNIINNYNYIQNQINNIHITENLIDVKVENYKNLLSATDNLIDININSYKNLVGISFNDTRTTTNTLSVSNSNVDINLNSFKNQVGISHTNLIQQDQLFQNQINAINLLAISSGNVDVDHAISIAHIDSYSRIYINNSGTTFNSIGITSNNLSISSSTLNIKVELYNKNLGTTTNSLSISSANLDIDVSNLYDNDISLSTTQALNNEEFRLFELNTNSALDLCGTSSNSLDVEINSISQYFLGQVSDLEQDDTFTTLISALGSGLSALETLNSAINAAQELRLSALETFDNYQQLTNEGVDDRLDDHDAQFELMIGTTYPNQQNILQNHDIAIHDIGVSISSIDLDVQADLYPFKTQMLGTTIPPLDFKCQMLGVSVNNNIDPKLNLLGVSLGNEITARNTLGVSLGITSMNINNKISTLIGVSMPQFSTRNETSLPTTFTTMGNTTGNMVFNLWDSVLFNSGNANAYHQFKNTAMPSNGLLGWVSNAFQIRNPSSSGTFTYQQNGTNIFVIDSSNNGNFTNKLNHKWNITKSFNKFIICFFFCN